LQTSAPLSTGLTELDRLLRGLIPGDNVVWRGESIEDYLAFVQPYCEHVVHSGRTLVYLRFARHAPLLPPGLAAKQYDFDPAMGFESFLSGIHKAIEATDRRAYYVFDCLSDLASEWYSDQMLCNFFMLTCPYLYDRGDIAYFALFRKRHSSDATMPIQDTAQIFLDLYRHQGKIFVRPLKAQQRYSPTMHMLHVWENGALEPVSQSCTIAEILAPTLSTAVGVADAPLDFWTRTLAEARNALRNGTSADSPELFDRLLRMIVTRDERVLDLVRQYLDFAEVVEVGRRTIGTGLIGGKSVGMLLARAILRKTAPHWTERLEVHDSFYVASDVFYTFLVRNGCWWAREHQKDLEFFLAGAEQVRRRIITGAFPEEIEEQFTRMLEYFGQSPIIVRSSSLLEDNFGNSFAGKYESVFCANQGSSRQRLEDFKSAVKTIYASAVSEEALAYRKRHGLLDRDEQMGLLVQRVSGALHHDLYYPHVAGVAFSFNPYVWNENIDPHAGMMRLVYGLGTRAVDRTDDDYTRIVALNAPERRPEGGREDIRRYTQRKVDVLDLDANQLVAVDFCDVVPRSMDVPMQLFASPDTEAARAARAQGSRKPAPLLLTFDKLLSQTTFVEEMRLMLHTLQDAYGCPVDVEFTANFLDADDYRIDLVQCRPLQVSAGSTPLTPPENVPETDLILKTCGPIIGRSRSNVIDRIIYVTPSVYGQLTITERYAVARVISRLVHLAPKGEELPLTMLLGPGRWGTTTPSLGVPVSFADINAVSILCEIVAMREDLVPDVSLGTHFFSELVETDMLYLALFPNQAEHWLNRHFLEESENMLLELLPDADQHVNTVHVIDPARLPGHPRVKLYADTIKQQLLCYLDHT
jgi:hypothetical protein